MYDGVDALQRVNGETVFEQFGIKSKNIAATDIWKRLIGERFIFHITIPKVLIIGSRRWLQPDVVIHVDLEHIIQGEFHCFLSPDTIISIFRNLLFFCTKGSQIGIINVLFLLAQLIDKHIAAV